MKNQYYAVEITDLEQQQRRYDAAQDALDRDLSTLKSNLKTKDSNILVKSVRKIYDNKQYGYQIKGIELVKKEAKEIKDILEKLELTIAARKNPSLLSIAAPLCAAIASATSLTTSVIKEEEQDGLANRTTAVASAIALLASSFTLIKACREYPKDQKLIEKLQKDDQEEIKKLVKILKKGIYKSELDDLRNNLKPNQAENKIRIIYWEKFFDLQLVTIQDIIDRKLDPKEIKEQEDVDMDKMINSFYAGVAIASHYYTKKEFERIKQVSEQNIKLMRDIANIDESDALENVMHKLRYVDPRLPTIYAQALYFLGRIEIVSKDKKDIDDRKYQQYLEDAVLIRDYIDKAAKGSDRYQDDYNGTEIKDSILFERSGTIEYKLQELLRLIPTKDQPIPIQSRLDRSKSVKQQLVELLPEYDRLIKEGAQNADLVHNTICQEKKIFIYRHLVEISDTPDEASNYTREVRNILFGRTAELDSDSLLGRLESDPDLKRMILMQTNYFIGISIKKQVIDDEIIKLHQEIKDHVIANSSRFPQLSETYEKNDKEITRLQQERKQRELSDEAASTSSAQNQVRTQPNPKPSSPKLSGQQKQPE